MILTSLRIVVVLENKVYVYNFADLQLLHQIETCPNPRGTNWSISSEIQLESQLSNSLNITPPRYISQHPDFILWDRYLFLDISSSSVHLRWHDPPHISSISCSWRRWGLCALNPSANTVLAVPGSKPGSVRVELYDLKQTQNIQAHNNSLTQICLSLDGTRLATASEKVNSHIPSYGISIGWHISNASSLNDDISITTDDLISWRWRIVHVYDTSSIKFHHIPIQCWKQ